MSNGFVDAKVPSNIGTNARAHNRIGIVTRPANKTHEESDGKN